jgi:hypothetical protein
MHERALIVLHVASSPGRGQSANCGRPSLFDFKSRRALEALNLERTALNLAQIVTLNSRGAQHVAPTEQPVAKKLLDYLDLVEANITQKDHTSKPGLVK